jgi:hypothetical protein
MPGIYSKNDHEVFSYVSAGTCPSRALLLTESSAAALYLSVVLHSWRSCGVDYLAFSSSKESSLVFTLYSDMLRSNADAE